ncbi:MAG: hypothetical protein M1826_007746 [Phylliscum demangeonii]|nr:MAG: hypothetical protein M1826_007746 [Phylliscum demangeonii]
MPHAHSMPQPGFQALILCGPGLSLNTFTSSPEEFPKALVPIANRPMVWYPLDWCYRMGITSQDIHLVTPPSSAAALEAALVTDPHLTSLPLPRADILAPAGLSQNSGTAGLLRLREVQAVVTGDFVVLPCDLVCEVGGDAFLESWMITQADLGGVAANGRSGRDGTVVAAAARRGGLGVWYETQDEDGVKGEETDFVATTSPASSTMAVPASPSSLLPHIFHLAYSLPTDTLHDITAAHGSFAMRHALLRQHGRVKIRTTHRDAHLYFFPAWLMQTIARNDRFDSLSEDVVGWWAKAGWQAGLGAKLGFADDARHPTLGDGGNVAAEEGDAGRGARLEDEIDLARMTSTGPVSVEPGAGRRHGARARLASRTKSRTTTSPLPHAAIPPMLAYMHPARRGAALIRRVDTGPLLLAVSLRLAKLESVEERRVRPQAAAAAASPLAHKSKIADGGAGLAARCTVTAADCLLAAHVRVQERAVIKESVVGAHCQIGAGARLTRCLLMDGVVVADRAQLHACILGRHSRVGTGATLRECEVQPGFVVPDRTEAKNEKFMAFEGLDADPDPDADAEEDEDEHEHEKAAGASGHADG